MAPFGVADRVNLGLIPTSEGSWPTACAALKPQSGGWLHIHANVDCTLSTTSGVKRNEAGSNISKKNAAGILCEECVEHREENGELSGRSTQDGTLCVLGNSGNSSPSTAVGPFKDANGLKEDLPGIFNFDDSDGKDKRRNDNESVCVSRRDYWKEWAEIQAGIIRELLNSVHEDSTKDWLCIVKHIEHVKSYAPHVDHIVVDMECRPVFKTSDK